MPESDCFKKYFTHIINFSFKRNKFPKTPNIGYFYKLRNMKIGKKKPFVLFYWTGIRFFFLNLLKDSNWL